MTCDDCLLRNKCMRSMAPEKCRIFIREKDYKAGYKQGVKDMAERLKNYYTSLPLPHTLPAVVEYNIRMLEEEMLGSG